jgi:hypothetical protein
VLFEPVRIEGRLGWLSEADLLPVPGLTALKKQKVARVRWIAVCDPEVYAFSLRMRPRRAATSATGVLSVDVTQGTGSRPGAAVVLRPASMRDARVARAMKGCRPSRPDWHRSIQGRRVHQQHERDLSPRCAYIRPTREKR